MASLTIGNGAMALRNGIRTIALLLTVLLLSACGFHLRGQAGMPFEKLYIETSNPGTPFMIELRRELEDNKVKLVSTAMESDVVLNIASEIPDKQILTLGSGGRVTEFRLIYHVSLRAYDLLQRDWIPAEEFTARRDYSYDDTMVLAKEAEESMLWSSMRTDIVQQIVQRLSRSKPLPR